jgi:lysozyme family protein
MKENWPKAMKVILKFEGGKDDDPIDPGGRTNQGVIQRVYAAWRRKKGLPARDVFLMEDHERDEIYLENYGKKVRFDELPPGIDVVVYDGAVNSGPGQSIKWLQRALGVQADGVLGDVTMERIMSHENHDALIAGILERRMAFLRALKTFYHFGKGWTSRVTQLKQVGQAWAMGNVGPPVVFVANGNKKATIVDAKKIPSTAPADATAAGGTVTTGLYTAQSVFEPLSGRSDTIDTILMVLIVAGVLATAFGFAYGYYVRNKKAELNDVLDLEPMNPGVADNDNLPAEVLREYKDPYARGSETGNMAPGTVTTSGRTEGDTEVRVHTPQPVPPSKQDKAA